MTHPGDEGDVGAGDLDPETTRSVSLTGDDGLDLADLLNTVLDRGAVVHGDVTIAVADVDLIRLNLGLLLAAVASTERTHPVTATKSMAATLGSPNLGPRKPGHSAPRDSGAAWVAADPRGLGGSEIVTEPFGARDVEGLESATLNSVARGLPERINADPDGVETGLARLVLTLIEVLRKVLEHQAVRRMEGGRLSDEEVEKLGLALSRLDSRMQDLKRVFGLSDEDLQIDLGPLGRLR